MSGNALHGIRPKPQDESGAAIIEMVALAMTFTLLIAGAMDLTSLVSCGIEANAAAASGVRWCMDNPSRIGNSDALAAYLEQSYPDLSQRITAQSAYVSGQVRTPYTHYLYSNASEDPIPFQVQTTSQDFSVQVACSPKLLLPVFDGLVGKSICCTCTGIADLTSGENWGTE